MTIGSVRKYCWVAGQARNFVEVIQAYRHGLALGEIRLWDGAVLRHPADRGGLAGTFFEVWYDECYTKDGFYRPGDGDVILDLGGHVGLFSLLMARSNPRCRVLVAEPFEENRRCLEENVAMAGAENVEVAPLALSGGRGLGRMTGVGDRSIDHRLETGEAGRDGVETAGLDDFVAMAGDEGVALAKIDVEGAEYDAFETVSDESLEKIDRFAIEYHDNLRPGTSELLRSRLEPTHDVRVEPRRKGTYGMLYAVRKQGG